MKTKEKRLGYVDILNSEMREKKVLKIITSSGVELETQSLKQAKKSLDEALTKICVGQKGAIYEVVLRRVK